jgi:hypothetical protein
VGKLEKLGRYGWGGWWDAGFLGQELELERGRSGGRGGFCSASAWERSGAWCFFALLSNLLLFLSKDTLLLGWMLWMMEQADEGSGLNFEKRGLVGWHI